MTLCKRWIQEIAVLVQFRLFTMAISMRDLGTAPAAMEAMAVEKKVMAQVGRRGEEVAKPKRNRSKKFCRSKVL